MFKIKNHNTSMENSSDLNTNTVFSVFGKETQTVSDQSSRLSLRKSCMETLSPDRLGLLLFSSHPSQLKTLPAWVLVAGMQRNFLASLTRVGYCSLLVLHHPRGSWSLSRAGSFLYLYQVCDGNKFLQI